MPMYDHSCGKCKTIQGIFKKIADLDQPEFCSTCQGELERRISAPMVRGDYAGYSCPITGDWIEGKRAHIENLKKHGCRVLEPGETAQREHARQQEEADFERRIGETVEEEITRLPAAKRDSLAAEMRAGLTAEVVRLSSQL